MHQIQVVKTNNPEHLHQLRLMLEAKWGAFDSFDQSDHGLSTPAVMVAINGNELVGGLVYSIWDNPEPNESGKAIWVNGLIVHDEYQRLGIASKLLRKAAMQSPQLFALVEIKSLYEKVGWQQLSDTKDGYVFKAPQIAHSGKQ